MGKLSLKKKEEPEKQQKISSFFNKPQAAQKKPTESPLFTTIRSTGAKSAPAPSTKTGTSESGVRFTHGSGQTVIPETQGAAVTPVRHRPTVDGSTDAQGDSDCEIIPATPDVAPASSKSRSYGRSFLASNLTHLAPGAKTQDKPSKPAAQKASHLKVSSKKSKASRNQPGGWSASDATMSRVLHDMGVPEVAKTGSVVGRPTATSGATGSGSSGSYDSIAVTATNIAKRTRTSEDGESSPPYKKIQRGNNDVQAQDGRRTVLKEGSGESSDKENVRNQEVKVRETVKKSKDTESLPVNRKPVVNKHLQDGSDSGMVLKEGESRDISSRESNSLAVSGVSEEVDRSRTAQTSKVRGQGKSVAVLGAGTRARQILDNSLKVGVARTPSDDSDSSESETTENEGESQHRGIVGRNDDCDNNVTNEERKFSFNKKNKQRREYIGEAGVKSSNSSIKSGEVQTGVIEDSTQERDLVLDDILGKMKHDEKGGERGQNENVPSVVLKKKKSQQKWAGQEAKTAPSGQWSVGGGQGEKALIDHTETDDALQDIMAELKETLTQQNKLSARKSSDKKRRQCVHREKEERLNASISKQLCFTDVTGEPVSGESDDIVPLDGHVTDSKAAGSLFEEDSWMDDGALAAMDTTTSPCKQNLSQSADKTRYDPSANRPPAEAFGRHVVKSVQSQGADVVLTVEPMQGGGDRRVVMHGFWTDTQVAPGDVVHVIGEFDESGSCHVTDKENFVVVSPDTLISGTSVVSTVYCMRKSVLNEKFKGVDNRSVQMLHGSIVHAFFQEVLQQRHLGGGKSMEETANSVLRQSAFLHEMYGLGVTQDSVMGEIGKFFPQVTKFIDTYMSKSGPGKAKDLEIQEVKDIEENVWSPRFGVKGKIDLTVEVKIHGERGGQSPPQYKTMPLELKTGKASFSVEHKGQVTLYSMMTSDRREDPGGGLLLYLREGQMRSVPAHYSHKRGLIQLRNELAHFLRSSSTRDDSGRFGDLPPPISNERSCAKCPHLLNCTAYSRVIEDRSFPPTHAMNKLVEPTLSHLTYEHREYFRAWCEMMHLEQKAGRSLGVSQLWCKTAYDRETVGEALCGMVLSPAHCRPSSSTSDKVIQSFERHPHSTRRSPLTDAGLTRGDSIVVSAENQPLIALCMGNVQQISDTRISLLVDRDLRKVDEYKDLVYRLDKCDTYNTMATNFTNLSRLMENSDVGDKLRELVIEKRPPQFELTISKTSVEKVKQIFKKLNKPQKTAILKVLMCQDYVLIKGYPGTGKTSTIVALVRILCVLGMSVLLTSYTHSAVDNILLKLKQFGVGFVRLGRLERIHPDIQPHAAEVLARQFTTVQQLDEFYTKQQVVATTCLGTNHVLFSRRRFDVCVVDEASQVLQPACLGPLFVSNKFVLVGDPRQLPPVVQSREAREKGMAESLFARLDATGGTYELNVQYRMNSEIVRLSNELVYEGALQCGSQAVADGKLSYTNSRPQTLPQWCEKAVSTEPGSEVIFLNTDKITCTQLEDGKVKNVLEASIIRYLLQVFVQLGVAQTDIGVIAPYRQQVLLLRDLLSKKLGQVEVNTVDQYQGRDKQVIVMSFVKHGTQDSQHVGGILQDLRRLNVALTRAKFKLILIGHVPTLTRFEPLREVVRILRDNQITQLPADVLEKMEGF